MHEKYLRGSTKAGYSRNTSRKKAYLQKETKRVVVPIQPPENPPLNYLEIKFLETILKRFINLESLVKKYRPLFRKRSRKKEAIDRTRKEAGIKSKRRTRRKIRKARNSKVRNSFFYRFYSGSYLELSCSGAA